MSRLKIRAERALRVAAGALFATQFAWLDIAIRGPRAYAEDKTLWLAVVASIALGASLLFVRGRSIRAFVAVVAGLAFVMQATFAHFWHVPIDRQIAVSALHNAADVRAVLLSMALRLALLVAVVVLLEVALALAAPVASGVRARVACAALALLAIVFGPPLRSATPELRLIDALAVAPRSNALAANAPSDSGRRDATPVEVPRERLPNVLFILTESVRASDACSAPDAACGTMPEMHALLPDRVPLRELRALSSYTAVSLNTLATGRTQTGDRRSQLESPTMFELVRRIRAQGGAHRPYVAYWSAQMASVFERGDISKSADSFVSVETLLGHAVEDDDKVIDRGVDRLLVAHALREIDRLPQPFFLFFQLSGTHAPYYVDAQRAPFAPWSRVVSWSTLGELHRAYKNAIVAQDAALAEMTRRLLARTQDAPLIVFYTSDHGEAFGEHGGIHHGQSLYDEQIHVPGWVASRGGGLSANALANLRAHERALVTHLDLLPSVLDAYGALDSFALRDLRRELPGRSFFSERVAMKPQPMTNCTALFPCPLNTWGMLGEGCALQAQAWDNDWRCAPLATAAALAASGEDEGCRALRVASRDHFPKLPNGAPNQ